MSRSPCWRTEMAKACVLKSTLDFRVKVKKAWGIGLESRSPKL